MKLHFFNIPLQHINSYIIAMYNENANLFTNQHESIQHDDKGK